MSFSGQQGIEDAAYNLGRFLLMKVEKRMIDAKRHSGLVLVCLLGLSVLTGCGSDKITGDWYAEDDPSTHLAFRSDGTVGVYTDGDYVWAKYTEEGDLVCVNASTGKGFCMNKQKRNGKTVLVSDGDGILTNDKKEIESLLKKEQERKAEEKRKAKEFQEERERELRENPHANNPFAPGGSNPFEE